MLYKELKVLSEYEGDTFYECSQTVLDIYPQDCVVLNNPAYSCCKESHDSNTRMDVVFYVKNKKNIVFDFKGAILRLHGLMQPFIFDGCENVTVKNVVVQFTRPFTTEIEVIHSEKTCLRGRLSKNTPCEVDEEGRLIPIGENYRCEILDKAPVFLEAFLHDETHRGDGLSLVIFGKHPTPDPKLPWLAYTSHLTARFDGEDILLEGDNVPLVRDDAIVAINHETRRYSTAYFLECVNVRIENFRLVDGPGMGILPFRCKNVYIDGLNMGHDQYSLGVTCNCADAIHAVSCSGDFVIRNSVIGGMLDDALNIHSNFFQYVSSDGNRIKVVNKGSVCKEYRIFAKGDSIRISKPNTVEQVGDDYKITGIERIDDTHFWFVCDKKVPAFEEGSLVENISTQPNVLIENCRFQNGNTHLRFQSRGNIVMKDCDCQLEVLLTGDTNYWYESSPCENMLIENVKFSGWLGNILVIPEFKATDVAKYYHKNLTVKDCSFELSNVLEGRNLEHLLFENNVNSKGEKMTITLTASGVIEAENAEIIRK